MFTEEQPQNPAPETPATETTPQPPATETGPKPASNVSSEEKMLAAAGYIPMLFVGSLIMKPNSKFCQMHAQQGVALTGLSVLVMFILLIIPALGSLFFLVLLGVMAIGGFQAYSGIEWKIPIVWDFASKINVAQFFAVAPAKPKADPVEPAAAEEPASTTPETPETPQNPS